MTELDAHAHELIGLAMRRLADGHPDGERAMFGALFEAWLGWAGAMHCPDCTRRVLEAAFAPNHSFRR